MKKLNRKNHNIALEGVMNKSKEIENGRSRGEFNIKPLPTDGIMLTMLIK